MKWKEIDAQNPYKGEVVALNVWGVIVIGHLDKADDDRRIGAWLIFNDGSASLCTHYIPSSELLSLPKEGEELSDIDSSLDTIAGPDPISHYIDNHLENVIKQIVDKRIPGSQQC